MSMIENCAEQCQPSAPARLSLLARVAKMVSLKRERQSLAQMDDSRLRDIGINRHDARAEAERSAWDVPDHWRR